jgi:hypothetical protein
MNRFHWHFLNERSNCYKQEGTEEDLLPRSSWMTPTNSSPGRSGSDSQPNIRAIGNWTSGYWWALSLNGTDCLTTKHNEHLRCGLRWTEMQRTGKCCEEGSFAIEMSIKNLKSWLWKEIYILCILVCARSHCCPFTLRVQVTENQQRAEFLYVWKILHVYTFSNF